MSKSREDPPIGRTKRLAFTLIMLGLVWAACDTGSYFLLRIMGTRYNLFSGYALPTQEATDGFREKYFHPVWGWDSLKETQGPLGCRKGRDYAPKDRYQIKVFGDSFAFGAEIEDDETFEYQIEQGTGWDCLNFGVGASGPDQALLKYEDNRLPSKYSVLTVLDENIERCVTNWWGFLVAEAVIAGGKPRFERDEAGRIVFVPNPTPKPEDLERMRDPSFIEGLKRHDYWNHYYSRINSPPALHWPASLTIVPHLSFFVSQARVFAENRLRPSYEGAVREKKFYHLYDADSEGIAVLAWITREFERVARGRGEVPVILLFPTHHTMDLMREYHRAPYQSYVQAIRGTGSAVIDFGEVLSGEEYSAYYHPGEAGHFTRDGCGRIADELERTIRSLDAGTGTSPGASG